MRIERQKRARKLMMRCRLALGYREPYQVLLDPEMIKHAVETRLFLKEQLPVVFQGRAMPLVTKCAVSWMRNHQNQNVWGGPALSSKRMQRIDCGHKPCLSPASCILSLLEQQGQGQQRYCVACMGARLRGEVRELNTVPMASCVVFKGSCGPLQLVPFSASGRPNPAVPSSAVAAATAAKRKREETVAQDVPEEGESEKKKPKKKKQKRQAPKKSESESAEAGEQQDTE